MQPGDVNGPPEQVVNCRCVTVGVLAGFDDDFTKTYESGIISKDFISTPISHRQSGVGDPYAITEHKKALNNQQQYLLKDLQKTGDKITVARSEVRMTDLSALTAYEKVEFSMFTRSNERMVVRGDEKHVYIDRSDAATLSSEGWRWSGHTHTGSPKYDTSIKLESIEDRMILSQFANQTQSAIYDIYGQFSTFSKW